MLDPPLDRVVPPAGALAAPQGPPRPKPAGESPAARREDVWPMLLALNPLMVPLMVLLVLLLPREVPSGRASTWAPQWLDATAASRGTSLEAAAWLKLRAAGPAAWPSIRPCRTWRVVHEAHRAKRRTNRAGDSGGRRGRAAGGLSQPAAMMRWIVWGGTDDGHEA